MSIPPGVRAQIRRRIWALADEIDWATLADSARSRKYEEWTRDPDIGGVLGNYIDPKHVRVYLKDSVIKPYTIARGSDHTRPLRALGLGDTEPVEQEYLKPHGRRFADGRIVCWGQARDWKAVIVSVWERAVDAGFATPYAAVLTGANGPWGSDAFREKAERLARRLDVARVVWLDP